MKAKFYFLSALFFLFIQMSAFSQDGYILVVGSNESDSTVIDILEAEGYTVVRGLDYSGVLSAEKLDSVNSADLVIFSRNGSTAVHGEAEEVMQQWADVEAPILSLSPWIMRNNRWRWINSTALGCHGSDSISIPVDEQDHPIFEGVDVSTGFLEVIEPGKTRNEKFLIDDGGNPVDAGTGTILAQDPTDDGIIAAEWEEGNLFYEGGDILAPIAASDRMWLGFVTEGDNCPEVDNIMSAFNGNDDAKTIFLNAVAYMQGLIPGSISPVHSNELSVFPNPATDKVSIENLVNVDRIEIYSLAGNLIKTLKGKSTIDVSDFAQGMYMLKVYTGNDVLSSSFIKK